MQHETVRELGVFAGENAGNVQVGNSVWLPGRDGISAVCQTLARWMLSNKPRVHAQQRRILCKNMNTVVRCFSAN